MTGEENTASLFIAAENWNCPKGPTIGKSLSKRWHAGKKESRSVVKNSVQAQSLQNCSPRSGTGAPVRT